MAAGDADNLAAELELALRPVVRLWRRAEDAEDLSPAQLRALAAIGRRQGLNLGQLAEELGTNASWASRLCDRLEAESLIERRPNPDSRREVEIALRPSGRRMLARLDERRRSALAELLANLDASQRREILAAVRTLAETVSS